MQYEPLKNQKQKIKKDVRSTKNQNHTNEKEFYLGFERGVDNSFDLFASFVDLFKRYKNNVKLLMDEQNNVWSKWVKYYEDHSNIDTSNYLAKYNDWLFDYLFSDINGETSNLLNL
jgi:hypothetical protein